VAIAALCALLVGAVMIATVTALMRPLARLVAVVENLAAGSANLKVALPAGGSDELARISTAFNTFVNRLAAAFGEVRDASVGVNIAAEEIASGNLDLSRRTELQASSLEQITSSIEDLSAGVRGNAATCGEAAAMTTEVTDAARSSAAIAGQAVSSMEEVQVISGRISEITSIIDGLAFQTNILALNAAVEAARAGTNGRGFAVVASEVRTLANHSAAAARDIKLLIEQSVGSLSQSTGLTEQTGRAVSALTHAVGEVAAQVRAISVATQRQAEGLSTVEASILQLDTVTQQNAALVEEAAAAAASLRQQTSRVSDTIAAFL
jgi:methyl-accepting chemotaxis protein